MKKPGIRSGIVISLALALPFVAILFLAELLLEVPFPGFDLFDFTSRNLPGAILTFGIDTMVDTIRALNIGPTDSTAKLAEQTMAVLQFTGLTFVSALIYYMVMVRVSTTTRNLSRDSLISGLILGLAYGLPLLAITLDINSSATASDGTIIVWYVVAFAVWGLVNGWVFSSSVEAQADATGGSVSLLNRRQFLVQLGGSAATITVVGAGLSALINTRLSDEPVAEDIQLSASAEELLAAFPNADAAVQPVAGTRPEYTPLDDHYRIDISSGRPPTVDAADYKLVINGLVDNPAELTLDQIQNDWEPMNMFVTMSCISNRLGGDLISTTLWTGVSMQRILDLVQPAADATHIKITAADGFDEYLALDVIREDETVMLCYAWDNQPLRQRHGFPLRVHIPNRFGMKQPKWITNMEFVSEWGEGYWVRRGWSRDAIAVTTSVIDTIAADMMIIDAETDETFVPVGGVAWAGARGIAKVEVRVDDGEWQETQLRDPLSDRSWVIWRYDWPFSEGEHTLYVRCVDGEGIPQLESERGVRPDGATGIYDMGVRL